MEEGLQVARHVPKNAEEDPKMLGPQRKGWTPLGCCQENGVPVWEGS